MVEVKTFYCFGSLFLIGLKHYRRASYTSLNKENHNRDGVSISDPNYPIFDSIPQFPP